MKIIKLSADTVIDGQLHRKGEIVQVDDGFTENVQRVVVSSDEQKRRESIQKSKIDELKKKKGK